MIGILSTFLTIFVFEVVVSSASPVSIREMHITTTRQLLLKSLISLLPMVTTTALVSPLDASISATKNGALIPPRVFIFGGFQIPGELYSDFREIFKLWNGRSVIDVIEDDNNFESSSSVAASAERFWSQHEGELLTIPPNRSYNNDYNNNDAASFPSPPPVILLGHSRGAAVAASVVNILMHRRRQLHQQQPLVLILVDPVDDAGSPTISAITKRQDSFSQVRPNVINQSPSFPPVAIISTPYGGGSRYYHTQYDSACAPPSRGSDAFFDALHYPSPSGKSASTLSYPTPLNSQQTERVQPHHPRLVVMLKLASLGHLQLLDDGYHTHMRFGGICAEVLDGDDVVSAKAVVRAFLSLWLSLVGSSYSPCEDDLPRIRAVAAATTTTHLGHERDGALSSRGVESIKNRDNSCDIEDALRQFLATKVSQRMRERLGISLHLSTGLELT